MKNALDKKWNAPGKQWQIYNEKFPGEAMKYGKRDCQACKGFDKYVTVDDADVYWCQGTICKLPGPQRRHSRISAM